MDQDLGIRISTFFEDRFGSEPLLVWSPGRINLIGEHTDYNLGYVLPAAIDRGIILALQKSKENAATWIASDLREEYQPVDSSFTAKEATGWKGYFHGILSELHKKGLSPGPYDLIFSGNIPPGAGLSSSAALENSLVFGLNELFELGLSRREMVEISHAAEQNYVGVRCGIMDQYASMFGRAGQAIFLDCRSLDSELIPVNTDGHRWLLLDTGIKHNLAETAYNERRRVCEAVATMSGVSSLRAVTVEMLEGIRSDIPATDYQKALYVLDENARVLKAVDAIRKGDLSELGRLMFASHDGLQYQYEVSCEELDFLVEMARNDGSIFGARMMGGGFGGCTLNLVRKESCESLAVKMKEAYLQKFGRELSAFTVRLSDGCRLLKPKS